MTGEPKSGPCLVAECDLVSIFGVVIGEREGGSGISVGMTGVVFGFCGLVVDLGLVFFLLFCPPWGVFFVLVFWGVFSPPL